MDNHLLRRIEKLSGISVNEQEAIELNKDMINAIRCINTLEEINTDDVEEFQGFFPYSLRLRADVVSAKIPQDVILSNASKKIKNMIAVPKIIR